MRIVLAISTFLSCFVVPAAAQWTVSRVDTLSTEYDELVCSQMGEGLIFARASKEHLINNLDWVDNKHYGLLKANWVDSYAQFKDIEPLLSGTGQFDDGTACYNAATATLWFGSANGIGGSRSNKLQIFSCVEKGGKWIDIKPFPLNSRQYHVAHPYLSPSGDQLFFSSDMPGGAGGMDIWYCNLLDSTWSAPIWMGPGVNSTGNELFPTYFQGEVFYSSDRSGNLDLWKATKGSQWKSAIPIEHLNSPQDDLSLIWLDNETGFFTSSREGNDDIFHFSKNPDESDLLNYTAQIVCKGIPIQNAKITVRNESNMIALQDITGTDGKFDLRSLNLHKQYTFKIEGVDPDILSQALLYVLDEKGNRIRVYHIGRDGSFVFQALPGDEVSPMVKVEEDDESILMLEIEGQVYEAEPGDVGSGEAVYIMSEDNELLALAYTSAGGQFRFPEVSPQRGYNFKVEEGSKALQLTIYEGENRVTVPINDRVASYQRLNEGESIRLINENNDPIYIKEDEVFIIRNIYYKFDSSNINVIAKQQLDQLGEIMKLNPKIHIELSSHTDSWGTDEYNMELSQRRATSAVQHLISVGVSAERMSSVGLGETKLLNRCIEPEDCPDELHALNRRTEIRMFVK